MIRSTTTLWTLGLFLFSVNAFAEGRRTRLNEGSQYMDMEANKAQDADGQPKERRSRRRLASVDPAQAQSMQVEKGTRPARAPRNILARFSLSAGYGVSNGSEVDNASDLGVNSDKGITFTLGVDVSMYRYFGFEIEGSSGLKATQSNSVAAETPFTQVRKRTISSLMTNLKFQVPFRAGSTLIIPKAGVGWATTSINDQESFSDSPDSGASSNTVKLNAPYVSAGLDVRPHRRWLVSVDFAKSIKGSANLTSSGSSSLIPLQNSSLTRIRASATYRLTNQWAIGGEFARRSVSSAMPLSDGSLFKSSVNQNQFLGVVQLDL